MRAQTTDEGVELEVWDALAGVRDPEIPPCSITDLGLVERITVEPESIEVHLLPTFMGCPALDVIHDEAMKAVERVAGHRRVDVRFVYSPPWTSDRITPAGRDALRSYGITPPGDSTPVFLPLATLGRQGTPVPCPFCGSDDTVLESAYGPTLCRTTHFCRSCRNPFEGFKAKQAKE